MRADIGVLRHAERLARPRLWRERRARARAKPGLWLHTTQGSAAVPLQNAFGFLYINTAGLFRFQSMSSSGASGVCDGTYSFDFNAWVATRTQNPSIVPGATVDLQCWYRDTPNAGGANLTNAMKFVLCP